MSTELACTAMYTMFACGEQAGFVFLPSPSCTRLSCWAQMFHSITDLPFTLFCCRRRSFGPEVFAFPQSVLRVNLCNYEWAFVLFFCSTERAEWCSEKYKETKSREGNVTQGWEEMFGSDWPKKKKVKQLMSSTTVKWLKEVNNYSVDIAHVLQRIVLLISQYDWPDGIPLEADLPALCLCWALCTSFSGYALGLTSILSIYIFLHSWIWNCRSWSSFQRCQNKKALFKWIAVVFGSSLTRTATLQTE